MKITIVAILFAVAASACGDGGPSEAERAAAREAELAAEAQRRAEREADREGRRLAALWTYHDVIVDKERQLTAAINSVEDVDTDGLQPARSVRLIFRDHTSWGRSSYLVLQAGDFDCSPRCGVGVTADSQPPVKMDAWRPATDEAIAMFIDDSQGLWRLATSAARVRIDFPVKAGGTRTATFDVAGLDASKLPGWE